MSGCFAMDQGPVMGLLRGSVDTQLSGVIQELHTDTIQQLDFTDELAVERCGEE